MSFDNPQNPGIELFQPFTQAEIDFLQHLANLSYSNGDMLYFDSGSGFLENVGIGTPGQVLTVSAGSLPFWSTPAGATQADWLETSLLSPAFIRNHYVTQRTEADAFNNVTLVPDEANWIYITSGQFSIGTITEINPARQLEYNDIIIAPETHRETQTIIDYPGVNKIKIAGLWAYTFQVGDSITISTSTNNDGTYVVSAVSDDGTDTTISLTTSTLVALPVDGDLTWITHVVVVVTSGGNITLENQLPQVTLDGTLRQFISVRWDIDSQRYLQNGGSILATNSIQVTYAQLQSLIGNAYLYPSQYYTITDFKTNAKIPGQIGGEVTGANEPLMVQATGGTSLAKLAWSYTYPDDIIWYEVRDTTSAVGSSSTGRISYRESTVDGEKRSAPYDFRVCLFYHPKSTYTIAPGLFPIQLTSVVIDGVPVLLTGATTYANSTAVASYLENPSNGLFDLASVPFAGSPDIVVFSLYNANNGTAGEWGDLVIVDQFGALHNITPSFKGDLYFTFGNTLQPFGGNYNPASDGDQRANNVHIKPCSDNWSSQVLNNNIFGASVVNWTTGSETVNCVICDGNRDGSIDDDCYYGITVKESNQSFRGGKQLAYANANTIVGSGGENIVIEDYNQYEVRIPNNAINWFIGNGMARTSALDLTSVLSLRDRVLKLGYSNMDTDVLYNAAANSITIPTWCGIANVKQTNLTAELKRFVTFPTQFNFKVKPHYSYFTLNPGATIAIGDFITGSTPTLNGKGQIINKITLPSGVAHYVVEVFSGTFVTEVTITSGAHSGTITSYVSESFKIDPVNSDPALVFAAPKNIKLNSGSIPVIAKSDKGAYVEFNVNDYDTINANQCGGANYL